MKRSLTLVIGCLPAKQCTLNPKSAWLGSTTWCREEHCGRDPAIDPGILALRKASWRARAPLTKEPKRFRV